MTDFDDIVKMLEMAPMAQPAADPRLEMPRQVIRFERRGRRAIWQLRPGYADSMGQPPYGERALMRTIERAEALPARCDRGHIDRVVWEAIKACRMTHTHDPSKCPDALALVNAELDRMRVGWEPGDVE